MTWKKHTPEEVYVKLGRVRAALASDVPLRQAIAVAGISEATYFRWRSLYGQKSLEQMRDLWQEQREMSRRRRARVAELEEEALA